MIFGDNILAFKRFMDKHYSDIPIRYVLDAQQEYQSYIGYQSNELPQNGSYSRIFLTMSYHEKYHPIIRKFVIFSYFL